MNSYKSSHTGENRGKVYDERYSRGYTAAMWESVERPLLEKILTKNGGASLECLDFACGTGRITQLLEAAFGHVTGVDISPDMLEQARAKCRETEFICGDLLANPEIVGLYDVVTSFRFFPNAEQELREKVMAALVTHLKPGGTMIVNNHQNSESRLGVLRKMRGSTRDFLAPGNIPDLLSVNGLVVREKYGFGKIPIWRDWPIVPSGLISRYEAKNVSYGPSADRDLNIIYVAGRE